MPTDEEVRRDFLVKDVYNFRSRNYLLRKLENHDRKEPVDVESYTIEHVMPQNPDLSPEWQQELGPDWKTVQERYLHTIGNLTLTGYNPELSDRPFSEKLTMKGGFRDSPLRLNHYLAQLEHWNEEEIQKRAALLADLALKVWPAPTLPEETLAKYRKTKAKVGAVYTLDDHPALDGPIRPLFDEFRRRVHEPRRRRPRGGAQAVHRLQADDQLRRGRRRWPASSSSTSTSRSTSSTTRTGSVATSAASVTGARAASRCARRPRPARGRDGAGPAVVRAPGRGGLRGAAVVAGRRRARRRGGERPGGAAGASARSSRAPFATASTRGRGSGA